MWFWYGTLLQGTVCAVGVEWGCNSLLGPRLTGIGFHLGRLRGAQVPVFERGPRDTSWLRLSTVTDVSGRAL